MVSIIVSKDAFEEAVEGLLSSLPTMQHIKARSF